MLREKFRIEKVSENNKTVFRVFEVDGLGSGKDCLLDWVETEEDAEKCIQEWQEKLKKLRKRKIMEKLHRLKSSFSFILPFLACAGLIYWAFRSGWIGGLLSFWFAMIGIPMIAVFSFVLLEKFHEWIKDTYWDGIPVWAYPIYAILGLFFIVSTGIFFIIGVSWFFGI